MEQLNQGMQQFNLITGEINAAYHQAACKLGLSDSVMHCLYVMSQCDVSQRDICRFTGLSKQTIHSAVRSMLQQDLIQELKGEKNEILRLTEKGNQMVQEKIEKLIHAENVILQSWDPQEQEMFLSLNRKYLEMFLQKLKEF